MAIKKQLKYLRFILPLIFIAGLPVLVSVATQSAPVSGAHDRGMSHLLDCGYIRRNIAATIFHPDFVLYLSEKLQHYDALGEQQISNAVAIWNSAVGDKRRALRYRQADFYKMATLDGEVEECEDNGECAVSKEDLDVLRDWMEGRSAEILDVWAFQTLQPVDLQKINAENNRDIGRALDMIVQDPVGRRLVANAVAGGITIRSWQLTEDKGYYDCPVKSIVVDPTVAGYVFKINCIVHELVHAVNPDKDNSVVEETLAEMIGMAVQDRITDIDISCHPYVVFVDRLLDPEYGTYPLTNNIEQHLRQAGIVIRPAGEEMP
jgi:hypothetical protein